VYSELGAYNAHLFMPICSARSECQQKPVTTLGTGSAYLVLLPYTFQQWLGLYMVRQKSGPLKFFVVFSATVWNF